MEAAILAGGLGTRLKSVINDVPKPMAPVREKPFLEYLLDYLNNNGFERVVLLIGYKADIIKNHFGDKYKNIDIIYSIETNRLGTGGAIKLALSKIISNEFFLLNGDTFFNIDIKSMSLLKNSKITIALKKMYNFNRYGSIEIYKNGIIKKFTKKREMKSGFINAGVSLVKKDIFDDHDLRKNFSFENFLEKNYNHLSISTILFENYFIDIGVPDDYNKFIKDSVKLF